MNKNITRPSGLKLLTAGKYCAEDIQVTPVLQEKTATENGEVTADSGYTGLSKVTVNVASGAELNIAYGDTAPEDTSKLWVEGAEPSKVIATNKMNGSETLNTVNAYLPNSYHGRGVASIGKYVYFFGGFDGSYTTTNLVRKLNTETNELINVTSLPTANGNMACASVGTKIYLFGGGYYFNASLYHSESSIYEFDTITETYTLISSSFGNYRDSVAIAVGNVIYIFGGRGTGSSSSGYTNRICKFDTNTKTFTTLSATLPYYSKYYHFMCASVGSDIYILGGRETNSSSSGTYVSSIYKFDTKTETRTSLNLALPYGVCNSACASVGNNIFLFGGSGNSTAIDTSKAILKFDTVAQTVESLNTTFAKSFSYGRSASVGNNIYMCGNTNEIYNFTVSVDLPQNHLLLNTTPNKNLFKIINAETAEIEIGVNAVYRGNASGVAELETARLYDATQEAWVDVVTGEAEGGGNESTGFQVTMSISNNYSVTVYDGTDTSGTGVDLSTTPTIVTCTSGHLTLSVGSAYYVGAGTSELGTITGDIQGSIISLSGSGYDDRGIQYTVNSDGSILDIPIFVD